MQQKTPRDFASGRFCIPCEVLRLFCVFSSLRFFGANEEDIHQQRDCVHNRREDEDVLITSRLFNDEVGNLVARQACNCPSRQRDAVQGRNVAHAVYVGEKGGKVAKATAVAKVDQDKQGDADPGDAVADCARTEGDCRDCQLAD